MFRLNPSSARVASHHVAFMGNWPTIIHTFLALSLHVNQEKWGAGAFQDSPMVESFSLDLAAIESYWTESHLEFCRISTTEFLCEGMWSAFR